MSTDIETRLRRAYVANGGSEQVFETIKSDLIADYRKQATIQAAFEEANKPMTMNDVLRLELQNAESRNDDALRRLLPKGTTDDAA